MDVSENIQIAENHLKGLKGTNKEMAELHFKKAKEWQEKGMFGFACTSVLNSLYYSVGFVHPDYSKVRKSLDDQPNS
jgi:hypothetical protein